MPRFRRNYLPDTTAKSRTRQRDIAQEPSFYPADPRLDGAKNATSQPRSKIFNMIILNKFYFTTKSCYEFVQYSCHRL